MHADTEGVGDITVDFKTIGGDANALSGYPTTHQFLVVEEVPGERCVVSAVVPI
jgi:hypothetical protein